MVFKNDKYYKSNNSDVIQQQSTFDEGNIICVAKRNAIISHSHERIIHRRTGMYSITSLVFDKPIVIFNDIGKDIYFNLYMNEKLITHRHKNFTDSDYKINKLLYNRNNENWFHNLSKNNLNFDMQCTYVDKLSFYTSAYDHFRTIDPLKNKNCELDSPKLLELFEYLISQFKYTKHNLSYDICKDIKFKSSSVSNYTKHSIDAIEHFIKKYLLLKQETEKIKQLCEDISMYQYIYLIKEREFVNNNSDIYKIGKTIQDPLKRLVHYPKQSKIITVVTVSNCHIIEKDLIKTFKSKFKWRNDIGNEYFEGDQLDMMNEIFKYASHKSI